MITCTCQKLQNFIAQRFVLNVCKVKTHFGVQEVIGWNVGYGKSFNCITNVCNNLSEVSKGKETGLSNFGNEWSL